MISTGSIVLAPVCDPNTSKVLAPHYGVVLTSPDDIRAGRDLKVAVISTSTSPMESGWFFMPSAPGGHETTGLTEACVVKATWLSTVAQSAVLKSDKRCPASIFRQINNWLKDKRRDALRANQS